MISKKKSPYMFKNINYIYALKWNSPIAIDIKD